VPIDPSCVCGFIYTSGTTGKPKGVLLSHNNIVSNINGVSRFFPIDARDISLCFLPWAHSFGQTCELHFLITRGAAMALAESVEKLIDNFSEIKPTILIAVPRIFNRIYDGLQKRIAEEGGIKKALFDTAMANAEKRESLAAAGRSSAWCDLKHKVLDSLVFSKVRDRFGGRLRFALSGGAALSSEVAHFIDRLGIFVCEGYGLTETSPITAANRPGARKIGSVGQPIPDVEVIIDKTETGPDAPDGEVVVKGPNVMVGYHGLPAATAEVLTEDGYFHTGDLGRLDEDGFLYITGRIKEQYKLQNGKYVVPGPLEDMLHLSGYIVQAFVDGSNQPYNGALIVPDRAAVEKWAAREGLNGDYESILAHEKTHALIEGEIEAHSKDFRGYERVRRFAIIPEEFSVENGLLTPKMSVKRRPVTERYADQLASLYP
jgi:long-chain acyl-CoA synthetase